MDALRGLCIISMVIAHVAARSPMYKVSHGLIWVDGAMGFVLLSGLVLGLVHRGRASHEGGLRSSVLSILRRTRLLWILNLSLTLLALVLGSLRSSRAELPSFAEHGVLGSAWRASVLALNPPLSILGMYVVLMLVAVGAVWMLDRGWTVALLVLSGAVYAAAALSGVDTSLPGQGSDQAFHLAAWQGLFILGLTIGWHWKERQLRAFVLRRPVVIAAAAVLIVFAVLAHLTVRVEMFDGTNAGWLLRLLFAKLNLGIGAILFTIVVAVVAYAAVEWLLLTRAVRVFKPVITLGRRSLDAYVISTALAMALPTALAFGTESLLAQLFVLLTLLVCWVWCTFKLGNGRQLTAGSARLGALNWFK